MLYHRATEYYKEFFISEMTKMCANNTQNTSFTHSITHSPPLSHTQTQRSASLSNITPLCSDIAFLISTQN